MRRLTIEHCHDLAKKHGGQCLSVTYINAHTKYEWECGCCSHTWLAAQCNVRNGSWCPRCSSKKRNDTLRFTIDDCYNIAKKRGGKCLSIIYVRVSTKYKWECGGCGYIWFAQYNSIQQGTWCPPCGVLKGVKKQTNSQTLPHWKTGEELVCVASYEIAVVNWLNEQKINFQWQPKTFKTDLSTPTGRRSTYRPDMYLPDTDLWIEIKGYFRKDAKQKWDWFQTVHPNSELWDKQKLKQMGAL